MKREVKKWEWKDPAEVWLVSGSDEKLTDKIIHPVRRQIYLFLLYIGDFVANLFRYCKYTIIYINRVNR